MNQPDASYPSRCQFRNAAGRQCRATHQGTADRFCPRHATLEQQFSHSPEDLSKLLNLPQHDAQSTVGVQAVLSNIFNLLAEDRISARRAAVLAYISSLLLRTISAINEEAAAQAASQTAAAENAPTRIIWNIPRPSHERHGAVTPQMPPPSAAATPPGDRL